MVERVRAHPVRGKGSAQLRRCTTIIADLLSGPRAQIPDLASLHYGPDNSRGPHNFEEAAALLSDHPEISQHSIHAAAAAGDVKSLRLILANDPSKVDQKGGPFQWTPLMYAAYARLSPLFPKHSFGWLGGDVNAHCLPKRANPLAIRLDLIGRSDGHMIDRVTLAKDGFQRDTEVEENALLLDQLTLSAVP